MKLKPSFNQFIGYFGSDTSFDRDTVKEAYCYGQVSIIHTLRSIAEIDEAGKLIWPIGATQKLEELLKMFLVENAGWCVGCSPDNCTGCGVVK